MSLLSPCVIQRNKYSFRVFDTTLQQTYYNAGVNLGIATNAKLTFKNLYDNETYEIDISNDWQFFIDDGIIVNIVDFPDGKMGEYDYFPDWFYKITISYTYKNKQYSASKSVGFRDIISYRSYQQLQQSDWKEELKCGCGCEKYSSSFRKFDYLHGLEVASKNCLINQYLKILKALHRLTGTRHEYDQ